MVCVNLFIKLKKYFPLLLSTKKHLTKRGEEDIMGRLRKKEAGREKRIKKGEETA